MDFEDEEDTRPPGRAARCPVVAEAKIEDQERWVTRRLLNLSEGGAFIVTPEPPPPGSKIHMLLDDAEPTAATPIVAEVRWVRLPHAPSPPGMGVSFHFSNPQQRTASMRRIRELMTRG